MQNVIKENNIPLNKKIITELIGGSSRVPKYQKILKEDLDI